MSGGHFDYVQHRFNDIADELHEIVANNDSNEKNEYGDTVGRHLPPEIIDRFVKAAITARRAAKMVTRIDWLLSNDDGQESFLRRWKQEGLDK